MSSVDEVKAYMRDDRQNLLRKATKLFKELVQVSAEIDKVDRIMSTMDKADLEEGKSLRDLIDYIAHNWIPEDEDRDPHDE